MELQAAKEIAGPTRHSKDDLPQIRGDVVACRRCPRLVEYREEVAQNKKREFVGWDYWGKPVPGFGNQDSSLLIVGLAPAAHGGNRTGRVFTGDRSGDFLVRMLYRAGFANQPTSENRSDGLKLDGVYITAAVKCAPPDNKPTGEETSNCAQYLSREMGSFSSLKAVLCLGQFAFNAVIRTLWTRYGFESSLPKFEHGLMWNLAEPRLSIFCSYHPSPRNTQTGKLSERMFLTLLRRVRRKVEVGRDSTIAGSTGRRASKKEGLL